MAWSWKIATVRGIEIRVHAAFLLLLLWLGGSAWSTGGLEEALLGVTFWILLFAIVVLHELGHALTAARYGIRTRDITLLPIGGLARLERMPEEPREELLIALAGPAVNVGLAASLALLAVLLDMPLTQETALGLDDAPLLARLVWVNVALAVFNLLPAFPMDGGRVLRALLAMRFDRRRATHIAAFVGQSLALLMGLVGLYGNPILVFIAVFVWLGARSESTIEDLHAAIRGMRVDDAMVRHFEVLGERDRLTDVSAHVVSGFQNQFPVVDDDGDVIGLLGHSDLIRGLSEGGPEAKVGSVMRAIPVSLEVSTPLKTALEQLERASSPLLPVLERGRLVGIITLESLGELLTMSAAVETGRRTMAHARSR